jgi:histidinol-phosphatase (PHP family)
VDSRNVSSYEGKDPYEMYSRYFEVFCEAAEHGGFDIMAHPDVIKKHGMRPDEAIDHLYEAAADALCRGNASVEINTSGLRKRTLEMYPSIPFLAACAERGVPVTLGSDAHAPWQVGMDFDLALRLLRQVGVNEIALFESRRRGSRRISV